MLVLMSFLAILLAGCVQKSVSSNESRNSNEITTDTSSTLKSKESTNDSTTDEKRSIDTSEVSATVKIQNQQWSLLLNQRKIIH